MDEVRTRRLPEGRSRSIRGIMIGVVSLALVLVGTWGLLFNSDVVFLMAAVFVVLASCCVILLLAILSGQVEFRSLALNRWVLSRIADVAEEGFVATDASTRIIYSNATYQRMASAKSGGEVLSVERLFSTGGEVAEAIYRLSLASREKRAGVEEFRLSKGLEGDEPAWYRVRTTPLEGPRQTDISLWSVADISFERERQENIFQELQQAIDYLDQAPAGFFSLDPKGNVLYFNATLAGWLGYDLAQFGAGALRIADIVANQSENLLIGLSGKSGETRVETLDIDLRRSNGHTFPARILHQITFDGQGVPGASRSIVLSRVPGSESDEGRRIAEIRFSRFFNHSPLAIATVTKDGTVLRTNAPFGRLFQRPDDRGNDVHDQLSIFDLLLPNDADRLSAKIVEASEGRGDIEPVDFQLSESARSARFYVTAAESSGPDEGEAAIVYVLDTTEQRALEAQFAQAQKMQAVGELAGGVAHDFNNVLQGILGYADLLLVNHRPTDPSFNDIMEIKQNANRAAGLVRHLLAFSRRQTLRPSVFQFTEVLSDATTLLKRLIGERIELTFQHGRDLWPVMADPTQFEQVIVNFAMNARDAMPNGGRLSISTRNFSDGETDAFGDESIPKADYVLIEVQDSGTGMPPDVLEKIFEPFFTTKEVGKGTGLGLSMVYGFVKQSGGFIFCESKPGEGTTFRILLPRHLDVTKPEGVAADMAAPAPAKVVADHTGEGTILLVDDETAVRAFGARALSQRGYRVIEASSGLEALEFLSDPSFSVDLVVSDVVMPEMDGPTLLREMRAKGIKWPFIFASGYAEDAFRKNLPEGEQFGFLPKPFSLKQLIETVKTALP
ncbi:MAG: cell cycle histidine kinase CckA [Hyphomicrobiales bacterium]